MVCDGGVHGGDDPFGVPQTVLRHVGQDERDDGAAVAEKEVQPPAVQLCFGRIFDQILRPAFHDVQKARRVEAVGAVQFFGGLRDRKRKGLKVDQRRPPGVGRDGVFCGRGGRFVPRVPAGRSGVAFGQRGVQPDSQPRKDEQGYCDQHDARSAAALLNDGRRDLRFFGKGRHAVQAEPRVLLQLRPADRADAVFGSVHPSVSPVYSNSRPLTPTTVIPFKIP